MTAHPWLLAIRPKTLPASAALLLSGLAGLMGLGRRAHRTA